MSDQKKNSLKDWRERIGEQEADKITKRATDIGTLLHRLAEEYLNNTLDVSDDDGNDENEIIDTARKHFKRLQPFLNKINNVCETEIALHHDYLMFAGTSDCIAEYDGILSIIDFKTSRAEKYEEWIEDYFLQATLYSMMYHNLTGVKISQIVILISGEDDSANQFVKRINDYVDLVFLRIHKFNIMEATS